MSADRFDWLDAEAAQDLAAEAQWIEPPQGAEDKILAAVLAGGLAASTAASTATAATSSISVVGTLKILGILTVLGVGVILVADGRRSEPPVEAVKPPVVVEFTVPHPIVEPQPAPHSAPTPVVQPAPPAIQKVRQRPQSNLKAEQRLLDQARTALKQHQPAQALHTLRRYRKRFPRGQLREEQNVLYIGALVALNRLDEARAEARRFHRRYPRSFHTQRVSHWVKQ